MRAHPYRPPPTKEKFMITPIISIYDRAVLSYMPIESFKQPVLLMKVSEATQTTGTDNV